VFFNRGAISAISRRILAIYLAMVLLLLAAFGLFVTRQASDQNEVALASAQTMAASAVRTHLDQMGRAVRDNAVWDEAYTQLTIHFSRDWADRTFGASVWNDLFVRLQGAFFVDGYDRTRYGVWNGALTEHPASAHIGPIVRTLIDQARQSDAPVSRIVIVDDLPKLISAAAVRPISQTLEDPSQPHGVLLLVAPMDQAFLVDVARTYSLKDVRWLGSAPSEDAQLPLFDADGKPAGALVWSQDKPGEILIERAVIPVVLLIVFCAMAGVWQTRLTMRAAKMLNAEHDRARIASARADSLSEVAATDTLTGLLNRRGLTELATEIASSARANEQAVAALVIDLDRFKPVNDEHGHHVGDEVLREVAKRLSQAVRQTDAVARFGGDEFVILTAPATREMLEAFATRLIEALSFPCRVSVGSLSVGASVGMALEESADEDVDSIIRRADRALFAAKQACRAQWRLAA
jgi:diguanylate cyclase (GGDEF)-like protein